MAWSSSTGPARTATRERVVATRKGARLRYSPGRIDPTNPAFDGSRKPLAAEFLWKGRTVFAIANHFNSKGGDQPLFGRRQPPVQSSTVQRHQQAEVLGGFVEDILEADPRAAIAVMGDFNDFQFSETLEILEDAGLANLMETLPADEQYSYVFDGNSQVLDQILVSHELMTPSRSTTPCTSTRSSPTRRPTTTRRSRAWSCAARATRRQ